MKPALVIIGLGNPGKSYARTRHNAGFLALDVLSEAFGQGPWGEKQKFQATVQEARIVTFPVLLLKPSTYMNASGSAVQKVVRFYNIDPSSQILIVSDDVDIPLGELRLRKSGGPGTHNGLKSIVDTFGEKFPRLRIGIGPQPKEQDLAAWVLSAFSKAEGKILDETLGKIPEIVKAFLLEEESASEETSQARA